jgi:hypothetical protein
VLRPPHGNPELGSTLKMKRMSSMFKKDKAKTTEPSTNSKSSGSKSAPSLVPQKVASSSAATKKPAPVVEEITQPYHPDNDVNRDGVAATFAKYAQVLHAMGRPMPTTGDGSYEEDAKSVGLLEDLKSCESHQSLIYEDMILIFRSTDQRC